MTSIPKIQSALCFIVSPQERFLIAKRAPTGFQPNRWGLIGGKIEVNESAVDALQREVKEEINLDVDLNNLESIGTYILHYKEMEAECLTYKLKVTHEFIPTLNHEHQEYKWVTVEECYKKNDLMDGLYILLEQMNAVKFGKIV